MDSLTAHQIEHCVVVDLSAVCSIAALRLLCAETSFRLPTSCCCYCITIVMCYMMKERQKERPKEREQSKADEMGQWIWIGFRDRYAASTVFWFEKIQFEKQITRESNK